MSLDTDEAAEVVGAVIAIVFVLLAVNLIISALIAALIAFAFSLPYLKTLAACWLVLTVGGWVGGMLKRNN